MKKILGLDLGVASIGWALINVVNDIPTEIIALGSRIIPLSTDDANEFSTGNAISKNQKRTERRTQRKGYDRYQLRRKNLTNFLRKYDMTPTEQLIKLEVLELWGLRAKAVNEQISLVELGRILYHLNQKRGYKSAKSDDIDDKKQKDYVSDVNNRYKTIKGFGQTIGQYFNEHLLKDKHFRTKEQVFPRIAYVEEFEVMWDCQAKYYPTILTAENKAIVRDEIIYYQRNLKSCKHLVSVCEFEIRPYKNKKGQTVYNGPKVAPRSSPLFQVCKNWESLNNIVLKNRRGKEFEFTVEIRTKLFTHLDNNEKLTTSDLFNILDVKKSDGWWGGKAIGKGLQGNTTKMQISKALKGIPEYQNLLQFKLKNIDTGLVDLETGEIVEQISSDFENEPLYRLWHTIYSINDKDELTKVLLRNFGIEEPEVIDALYKIDFRKAGFGNKSSKAIRRILPYLQNGLMYSEACLAAGFRHSESLTVVENEARELLSKLPQIKKNELKQPIVEKILNQMINLVNAVIDQYGTIDEIRVELARELKQSKDERNATDKNMRQREKENDNYANRILQEYGLTASRTRIQKFRMWEESKQKCFYCGQTVNVMEFLKGLDVEVEHIIPKSLFFDDGFSNKVCACRKCNSEKGNQTAFDYMRTKADYEFEDYLIRIEDYYKNGDISKTKKERLLTSKEKIPTDFIDRQLRETQYIARKSKAILSQVTRNVWATSGSVTDFVRHTWGWDKILHDLQVDKYRAMGQTEIVEFIHKNQKHKEERIKDWSKRLDHRHHAVDALVVACTKQSFIQRLNNLNTERDSIWQALKDQSEEHKEKFSSLENWMNEQPHFSKEYLQNKVAEILVSFKAGKKSASIGTRSKYVNGKKIILQEGIIVPRGALHEEGVYGEISRYFKDKKTGQVTYEPQIVIKYDVGLGSQGYIFSGKETVEIKYKTDKKTGIINIVIEDKIQKVLDSIIDERVKKVLLERLNSGFENGQTYKDDPKKALNSFRDLINHPIYLDKNQSIPIKSVRCFTGLSAVEPLRYNDKGEAISFVKPGNNHHIAFYHDQEGNKQVHVVTFWHAVQRKKYGIPVFITEPTFVWDFVQINEFPEAFLKNLPNVNWTFENSLQQNEMFILGMSNDEFTSSIEKSNYELLSKFMYKIQNLSANPNGKVIQPVIRLCHHIETRFEINKANKSDKRFLNIVSIEVWNKLNPVKITLNCLGKITSINGKAISYLTT